MSLGDPRGARSLRGGLGRGRQLRVRDLLHVGHAVLREHRLGRRHDLLVRLLGLGRLGLLRGCGGRGSGRVTRPSGFVSVVVEERHQVAAVAGHGLAPVRVDVGRLRGGDQSVDHEVALPAEGLHRHAKPSPAFSSRFPRDSGLRKDRSSLVLADRDDATHLLASENDAQKFDAPEDAFAVCSAASLSTCRASRCGERGPNDSRIQPVCRVRGIPDK